jgi:hypothetical protein
MTFGRSSVWLALCAVAALLSNEGYAFLFPSAPLRSGSAHSSRVAPVHMGWFDAVKKGFENEEMSQPAPNAGLKNVRKQVVVDSWNDDVCFVEPLAN